MRTVNHLCETTIGLITWLEDTWDASHSHRMLVQVFDSRLDEHHLQEILHIIHRQLPEAVVMGTSGCGAVSNGHLSDHATLVTVSEFESTSLASCALVPDDPYECGMQVAQSLVREDTRCLFLYANSMRIDMDQLVKGFRELAGEKVTLAGGAAGDNFRFEKSFVIHGVELLHEGVVAVALNNEALHCFMANNFGWKRAGRGMLVTRSEGNLLYELEGASVLSMYGRYLGKEVLKNLPESIIEFPLVFDQAGHTVARTIIGKAGEAVRLCGEIDEGNTVYFGIGDEKLVREGTAELYVNAASRPIESLFIFSSAARKVFFDTQLEQEYRALSDIATSSGCLTYGEFATIDGKNGFFNLTTAVLGLSESSEVSYKLKTGLLHPTHRRRSTSALSHLMETTSRELLTQLEKNRALIKMLEQYRFAMDTSLMVSKSDKSGVITYVNGRFCDISGYSESELIGQPFRILRHPDMSPTVFKELWEQIRHKQPWSGMVQNRAKNGDSYYVHATVFPILDENGEIIEYMALHEDLTSMVQYEKSLLEQQEHLHTILDNQESIVVLTSMDGKVDFLNQKFFERFDYKDLAAFQARHEALCELFVDKHGQPVICTSHMDFMALEMGRDEYIEHANMTDKQGDVRTFRIRTKRIEMDSRSMYLSTLVDITEIERARMDAEEAKNAKANFLANMSHEIRTPMNGIIGYTSLLAQTRLSSEQQKYLDVIGSSTQMLMNVVNEILDFSKIEQGNMELSLVETNLFREIELLYMNFMPLARSKSLEYRLDADPAIDECLNVDSFRLKQVLANLINNAIKFTDEYKRVVVTLRVVQEAAASQRIEFAVEDSGIGISASRQAAIFEAFSQEDSSTTRRFGGTGLGLSISASLVELMGGNLILQSEKGKGSHFSFTLELSRCASEAYRIKEKLQDTPVRLQQDHAQSDEIAAYLRAFGIEPQPLTSQGGDDGIDIRFDEEKAAQQDSGSERGKVIRLDPEAPEEREDAHHVINSQQHCNTRLYNALFNHLNRSDIAAKETQRFSGRGIRVLVADDNGVNQLLIEEMLHREGIDVALASNGYEAYEKAMKERFDLIFMDINMPVMNGVVATLKILNESQLNAKTPIVALTSNVFEEDIDSYARTGMYALIGKPVNHADLEKLLDELFGTEDRKSAGGLSSEEIAAALEEAGRALELPDEIMLRLLEKFILSMSEIIEQMAGAIAKGDARTLLPLTHKLKGGTESLCLWKMTADIDRMEKAVRDAKAYDYEGALQQLSGMLETIRDYHLRMTAV